MLREEKCPRFPPSNIPYRQSGERNRHDEIWRVRFSRFLQREEATLLSGQRLEMAWDDRWQGVFLTGKCSILGGVEGSSLVRDRVFYGSERFVCEKTRPPFRRLAEN